MGTLLPNYRKNLIDSLVEGISSNSHQYYAFAANPIVYTGNTPAVTSDLYSSIFTNDWQMLFGKKLANTDFSTLIENIPWVANTVYDRYDNNIDLTNLNYYVIIPPVVSGGNYNVYKCIDNSNNSPSIYPPNLIQSQSFKTADEYIWRYITSIPSSNYDKFSTLNYVPIYSNTSIVAAAYNYSGVETVNIINSGNGYSSYNYGNNYIRGVVNSTLIQIEPTDIKPLNFYVNNSIYIYNTSAATSQLKTISYFESNSSGSWVKLTTPANTVNITTSLTQYIITPRVVFDTDGDVDPVAYATINTTANSINSIVFLDNGYGISWANISIVSSYGNGAVIQAICPPAGGHGHNSATELNVKALGISFYFSNSESNTIPTNIPYNKVGIIKDPTVLNSDGTKNTTPYSSLTYSAVLNANLIPSTTFTVGEQVYGSNSGSRGTVAFCNGSQIYLTGDKNFIDGEYIVSGNGTTATITINTKGNIYTKDLEPLYVQNITNIQRSNTETESFKLIIQI